jgi:hypothetical protein
VDPAAQRAASFLVRALAVDRDLPPNERPLQRRRRSCGRHFENSAVFYSGWLHADDEPDGTYVFRFTVHGMLNGTPVDLIANSPPIQMIR